MKLTSQLMNESFYHACENVIITIVCYEYGLMVNRHKKLDYRQYGTSGSSPTSTLFF